MLIVKQSTKFLKTLLYLSIIFTWKYKTSGGFVKPNIYSKPTTTTAQRSRFWVLWYVVQQPSGAITTTTSTGGISNIVEQQQQQQLPGWVGSGVRPCSECVMAG